MVIAAEQYASRLVVPQSQQHSPMRWPSHKDHAGKALAKLAGPHLPASLKQLEKAVAKAKAERDQATRRTTRQAVAAGTAVVEAAAVDDPDAGADAIEDDLGGDPFQDEDLDQLDEEPLDVAGAIGPDGAVYSDADPGL